MFAPLKALFKKYSEIVVFGVSFGVSGYLCSTGVLTQCVSAFAIVQNAVAN